MDGCWGVNLLRVDGGGSTTALFPISIPMMGVYELLGIAKYGSVVSNHMPIMFIPHTVTIMESGAFCRFAV